MVLQSAGPKNASSMPEASYLSILTKLARTGVKDLLRISDPRMSGIYSSMKPCLPSVRWDKLPPLPNRGYARLKGQEVLHVDIL